MDTKLHQFDFLWQAEELSQLLSNQGIKNKILFKPREYAQIVTGSSQPTYEVFIDSIQKSEAETILKTLLSESKSSEKPYLKEVKDPSYESHRFYSKVIFFSVAAPVSFPLIFHWVAWLNFKELKKTSISKPKFRFAGAIFVTGLIISLIEAIWFINELFH